jgi:hypothetical protein
VDQHYLNVLEGSGRLARKAKQMNLPIEDMGELMRARARRRRPVFRNHYRGSGPTGIPEERLALFRRVSARLDADYERHLAVGAIAPGERGPTKSDKAREAIFEELKENPERWDPVYFREVVENGVVVRQLEPHMATRAARTFLESVREAEKAEKSPANRGQKKLAA